MYNIHRDREFPMKTNNLAALFLGLFESPSYLAIKISTFLDKISYILNKIFYIEDA